MARVKVRKRGGNFQGSFLVVGKVLIVLGNLKLVIVEVLNWGWSDTLGESWGLTDLDGFVVDQCVH